MKPCMTRLTSIALACSIAAWADSPLAADERPTPTQLSSAVSLALDPDRTSTRDFKIEVEVPDNPSITWQGKQMRKTVGGKRRVLTVFTDPPSVAGFAILATETSREKDTHWMYAPPVRRIRRLVHEGRFENFLGTDFTIGDFGFLLLDPAAMQIVDEVSKDGRQTWLVRETWNDPTGYSRIVTWVTTDTHIPIRREYYDPAGALWKVDTREKIVDVEGVPVPSIVTATSVQQGSRTKLTFDNIRFDAKLEDAEFEPERLGSALQRATARAS